MFDAYTVAHCIFQAISRSLRSTKNGKITNGIRGGSSPAARFRLRGDPPWGKKETTCFLAPPERKRPRFSPLKRPGAFSFDSLRPGSSVILILLDGPGKSASEEKTSLNQSHITVRYGRSGLADDVRTCVPSFDAPGGVGGARAPLNTNGQFPGGSTTSLRSGLGARTDTAIAHPPIVNAGRRPGRRDTYRS